MRPCDVVKLQKHGGCVPGMELEIVPRSPLAGLLGEATSTCSCPFSTSCLPSSARRIALVSLLGYKGIRFVLEGSG